MMMMMMMMADSCCTVPVQSWLLGVSFLLHVGGYSPLAYYFKVTNLFRSGGRKWLLLVPSRWFEWTDSSHFQLNSECTEMPGSIRAQGTTQTGCWGSSIEWHRVVATRAPQCTSLWEGRFMTARDVSAHSSHRRSRTYTLTSLSWPTLPVI